MKTEYKILLGGLGAIATVDTVGSIASRLLNFNYSWLILLTILIYGTVGFLVTKTSSLRLGVFFAALVGLFDSTVGWWISIILGANTGDLNNDPTIAIWIITSILVTGFGALIGLVGAGLAKVSSR